MKRDALHAYISPEAYEGWQEFCGENGVSVTGLVEVIGQELASEDRDELFDNLILVARRVDSSRRRRHGRSNGSQPG